MKVEYKAELKGINKENKSEVHVECKLERVFKPYLPDVFVAIIENMKNTDKDAFYIAMTYFISEELIDD